MQSIQLSGLFVQPIALRIREWNADGKINENDLEEALSSDARALVDHVMLMEDWAPIETVENLLELVVAQIGGETGLVEWADEIVDAWQVESPFERLIADGQTLCDGPGFVVSLASQFLLRFADWSYDGGPRAFSVRLNGLGEASSTLKVLLGAVLARLAMTPTDQELDVRFDGVDTDSLIIFGEAPCCNDLEGDSRLHRAALIA